MVRLGTSHTPCQCNTLQNYGNMAVSLILDRNKGDCSALAEVCTLLSDILFFSDFVFISILV